jgi:hypothetical protein
MNNDLINLIQLKMCHISSILLIDYFKRATIYKNLILMEKSFSLE